MSIDAGLALPPMMPWLKPANQSVSTSSQLRSQVLPALEPKRDRPTALDGEDTTAAASDASPASSDGGEDASSAWHTMVAKDLAESVGAWGVWLLIILVIAAAWWAWRKWSSGQESENRLVHPWLLSQSYEWYLKTRCRSTERT